MYLETKNITKKYKNFTALDNFSFTFEPGIYAILGPNGAGKSTLINTIVGLCPYERGNITLFDEKRQSLNIHQYLGFLPQSIEFYNNYTPIEMLKYIAKLKNVKLSTESIFGLLDNVNLCDVSNKKIVEFSQGMKQKLGIAQALINNPKLLIFDEPTAGLDPKERIRFKNLISKHSNKIITIIATHIVSDVENISHQILIIKNGKLLINGKQNELEESIKDFVWEMEVDEINLETINNEYLISKIISNGNNYHIKIINKNKPFEQCVRANIDLEDVYLFYTEYLDVDL